MFLSVSQPDQVTIFESVCPQDHNQTCEEYHNVIVHQILYNFPVNMTIGSDEGTAALVTKRGAIHHSSTVNEICIDEKYKIVSTAAYMLASNILDAYSGINKLVHKVVELA